MAGQITRLRFQKTVSTVKRIMDGRGLDSPSKRAEILFCVEFPAVVIREPGHARHEDRTIASLKPGGVLLPAAYTGGRAVAVGSHRHLTVRLK